MADIPLPTNFYFRLSFHDTSNDSVIFFQEVSGISNELSLEEITEGGENRFIHRLPSLKKVHDLVLKRGIVNIENTIFKWIQRNLDNDLSRTIQTKDILVDLLNTENKIISSWSFTKAYPIKWSIPNFDAMKNEIALESVNFAYVTLKRTQ